MHFSYKEHQEFNLNVCMIHLDQLCKDQTHKCEISQDQGVGLFW